MISRAVPRARRRVRLAAPARMLLLVLLALGVAGMHTLGHLSAHGEPHAGAPGGASAAGAAAGPAAAPGGHDGSAAVPGTRMAEACPPGHCPAPGDARGHEGDHGAGHGTDPTALCLAVLTLVAVALFAAARYARPATTRAQRWLRRLLGGLAPPAPPDLARLQVLRV